MKTTIRGAKDTIRRNKEDCMLLGGDFNGRIRERGARNWEEKRRGMVKENPKTRWRIQRGRD
jgi:hypothetical protein